MTNIPLGGYSSMWADLRSASFQQGWLDAGGVRTRYLMAGDHTKPLLLLLHGVGGHAEAYVRNLGVHAEHFWTVAIDMIGHGWSDKPPIDYQVRDYANHVMKVMDALGRDRASVSGESLGGWVATWLAVHEPKRVEKLVLNTAGGWTAHPEVMARIKTLSNQAAADPTWERIRARLEFLMFDKLAVSDDLIETRRAIYAQPGFAESMRRIMCLQDMEVRRPNMITERQYRSIVAPTLVVWTSHDPTATPEEGAQIAGMIPNSRFIVMNGCGHWPQFEDAALFNRVHVDFLLGRDISGIQGLREASGPATCR
jgi:2-hydroxy-6-oxonona-2,4-dienedioate hydrolase